MKILATSLTLAALAATPVRCSDLRITTVADGVYALIPTDAAIDAERAISNSGAIVLDDGVLLFDSHLTPELVEQAKDLLRPFTDAEIRYVVDSHWHGDHTGGDWAYGPEVEMITHEATRERLLKFYAEAPTAIPARIAEQEQAAAAETDQARREVLEHGARLDRELLARIQGGPPPLHTLSFDSKLVLHRGRRVEVYFLGRGHTGGDAVAFLPEEKVAFVGDLVFAGALPFLRDAYTGDWIETLNRVLALGAERYVPGHGPVSTADALHEQIGYLEWLRSAVRPFAETGRTLEEAQAAIELPERYRSWRWADALPGNIAHVFAELSGES